jgi:hypothetical protein
MTDNEPATATNKRRKLLLGRKRIIDLSFVVLGVFIALVLENLVQELRYLDDAVELEEAFADDFYATILIAKERQALSPCLKQRLAEIERRVSDAVTNLQVNEDPSARNLGFVMRQVYRAPTRVWITSSFDRAISSEAFKRVPDDRANSYASTFALIANIGELNDAEFQAIAEIAPLAYEQSNWTPGQRYEALQKLAVLDRYQTLLKVNTGQALKLIYAIPGMKDSVLKRFAEAEQTEPGSLVAFSANLKSQHGDCVDISVFDEISVEAPVG